MDGSATRLPVTAADGYRVRVPLVDAVDALLAVDRLDTTMSASLPRLVGAGIGGPRSVSRVRRLGTAALAPAESRDRYERLGGVGPDSAPDAPAGAD